MRCDLAYSAHSDRRQPTSLMSEVVLTRKSAGNQDSQEDRERERATG